jgi:hypothetical protein
VPALIAIIPARTGTGVLGIVRTTGTGAQPRLDARRRDAADRRDQQLAGGHVAGEAVHHRVRQVRLHHRHDDVRAVHRRREVLCGHRVRLAQVRRAPGSTTTISPGSRSVSRPASGDSPMLPPPISAMRLTGA